MMHTLQALPVKTFLPSSTPCLPTPGERQVIQQGAAKSWMGGDQRLQMEGTQALGPGSEHLDGAL